MTARRIVVVTLNKDQGRFLRDNVDSVREQDAPGVDVVHVVVDPGSTDGSDRLYEEPWAGHLQVLREPDSGPADGLNNGFRGHSADFGMFLNADDYLLPGAITRAVERLACRVGLVMGPVWVTSEVQGARLLVPDRPRLLLLANDVNYITQPGSAFSLDLLRAVGGFNTDNRVNWDHELYCRFVRRGARVGRLAQPQAVFRLHDGSFTSGAGRRQAEIAQNAQLRAALGVRAVPPSVRPAARIAARLSDPWKLAALARARRGLLSPLTAPPGATS